MATRFTRVTVVNDGRQLDVSLPASRPVRDLLPQLCDLLSLPPAEEEDRRGGWSLSTVAGGQVDARGTLDDAGVVDADVLYLTPPAAAPPPPFVDEVIDEVRNALDEDGSAWAGRPRLLGSAALAAVAFLAIAVVGAVSPGPAGGRLALFAASGLVATGLGRLSRGRGGGLVVAASLPVWALTVAQVAVLGGWDSQATWYAGLVGLGVGLMTFAVVGGDWSAGVAAGVALAPLALLGMVLAAAGLEPARVAGVLVVLVLFALGLAPQVALARSGLVPLVRAQERGTPVARTEVTGAMQTGQRTLSGAVAGVCAVAAVAAGALLAARSAAAAALGGLAVLVYALRSRAFTRAAQALPLLGAATVAAAVGAIMLPQWLLVEPVRLYVSAGALLLLAVAAAWAGRTALDEVAAARVRQLFDAIEAVAVIGVVPLVLAVFGAYDWARSLA
jgi:type VII secretion integral membrane protein EccD